MEPADGVERRVLHERPGFRITELRLRPGQELPWHRHSDVEDTYFVLDGQLRLTLRDPDEVVVLERGTAWSSVRRGRPHHVVGVGGTPLTFLVLQGFGEYDFVPLP
jgi:quercetin dioxygenase-like cupin family protein